MELSSDEHSMKQLPYVEASSHGPEPRVDSKYSRDEIELARYGKKQQLKVYYRQGRLKMTAGQMTKAGLGSETLACCPLSDSLAL